MDHNAAETSATTTSKMAAIPTKNVSNSSNTYKNVSYYIEPHFVCSCTQQMFYSLIIKYDISYINRTYCSVEVPSSITIQEINTTVP